VGNRSAERSKGTRVALAFPLLASLLGAHWLLEHGWSSSLAPLEAGALLVAVALADRVEVPISGRTIYTFSSPITILAALLGGPLLGLTAGMLAGVGDIGGVWRRRAAYGGLCAIQGYCAGLVGLMPRPDTTAALLAEALAVAVVALVSTAGRALVYLDRGVSDVRGELTHGLAVEGVEGLIAVPMLALLVVSFADAPLLVLATVASLLGGLGLLHAMRRSHASELSAALGSALTDALTGAPNRLAFEDALTSEHGRVVRGAQPAGLFLVDIDRFKSVNDRYGHPVGDRVLIEVVDRLRRTLRRDDVVCRWGGEELAVLAPGLAEADGVAAFAERLRNAVAAEPVPAGLRVIPVTVSIGGTMLDGTEEPQAAVARADRALYEAKRLRNRTVVEMPERRSRLAAAFT
jgi:diguanylate cyclase (GGDEF)-like protein